MIESHMPFDYLWQLLEYHINSQAFYANNKEVKGKYSFYFNYTDSIKTFDLQSENERLISSISRIEKNGIKNLMTAEYLKNKKIELEYNKMS